MSFAVHGIDENGKAVVVRPKVAREHLLPLVAQLPPCLICMEACSEQSKGPASDFVPVCAAAARGRPERAMRIFEFRLLSKHGAIPLCAVEVGWMNWEFEASVFEHVDAQMILMGGSCEFASRPIQPTGRGLPEGRHSGVAFSLVTFLLAKQEKVTCCRATPGQSTFDTW
jgi:hypothetical protein